MASSEHHNNSSGSSNVSQELSAEMGVFQSHALVSDSDPEGSQISDDGYRTGSLKCLVWFSLLINNFVSFSSSEDENCQFSDRESSEDENCNGPYEMDTFCELEDTDANDDGPAILKTFLGTWATDCNVPGNAINRLLRGLKSLEKQNNTFDELPLDVRSLLQTPRNVEMEKHPDGVYYHFGLSEWIREKFSDLSDDQVPNQADILVNIDGIPLCKSSSSQFWPILGLIKGEHVPFTIGVFHGPVKPNCPNVYLRRFVSEVIFLQNNSIIIIIRQRSEDKDFVPCLRRPS